MKTETLGLSRWNKLVCAATLLLLSPVIGMVLVFVVLPALPIVLGLGAVLGPMTLMKDIEPHVPWGPAEWRERRLIALEAHA